MNDKALVKFDPEKGFAFEDLDGMYRAAECFLQSGFSPRGFTTPQQLIICWARAAELGIRPLQACEGMNVINGRLGIGGDLALAKVRSVGLLKETPKRVYSGEGDDFTCTVTLHRKGEEEPRDFSFSIREAKQAGIYNNNWPKYPQRMVYYRALGFGLRDMFSDVLKGMYTSEELEDFQDEEPLKADVEKIARNQAAEDAIKTKARGGVKFVEQAPGSDRPTPAEAAEPAFPEDAAKKPAAEPRTAMPPFAQQLEKDFGPVQTPIQKQEPPQEPDELDMAEEPAQATAPAQPEWMDHVIVSIPHPRFEGKKISDLDTKDLLKIETQWIPKIEADMANASDDQKLEYRLFQSAIAYRKMAKPF
jgi:RecT family